MNKIQINNELAENTYQLIKQNLGKAEDRLKQLNQFKVFVHDNYFRPEDLNGIFLGINNLKQENLLDSLLLPQSAKKLKKEFTVQLLEMYWDCALLFKTMYL